MADPFLKMNEVNQSIQRKPLTVCVANDKYVTFQVKIRVLEKYVSSMETFIAPHPLKDFLIRWLVMLANVIFWYCRMKGVYT